MTPQETADAIDAILYSERTKEEMLRDLELFVKVGDGVKSFCQRTGLAMCSGWGSGPGIMHYDFTHCGLELITAPDERMAPDECIHLIRRHEREVDRIVYPRIFLTSNVLALPSGHVEGSIGYMRRYQD